MKLNACLIAAAILSLPATPAHADSLSAGLIGYWTGNGNAYDTSSIDNNGSFGGSYAAGDFGQEAFNLSTGTVEISDIPAYSFQDYPGWTVGFWFEGNPGTFLGQDDGPGELPKWFIDYGYANPGPGNTFIEHINNYGSNPRVFLPSDPEVFPSGWNQLTVVNGGGQVTFYLNGQNIGSDAYGGGFPDPGANLSFGYLEPCCQYSGLMQDVGLWDRALSPGEVALLASGSQPAGAPEPATAWMLFGGLGLAFSRRAARGVSGAWSRLTA